MVNTPIGNHAVAANSAVDIVRDGGAEQFALILERILDKRSANLIATSSSVKRTLYIERVIDLELLLPAR